MKRFFKALFSGLGWIALYFATQYAVMLVYALVTTFGKVFNFVLSNPGGDYSQIITDIANRLLEHALELSLFSVLVFIALVFIILSARGKSLKWELALFAVKPRELPAPILLGVGLNILVTAVLSVLPLPEGALSEYARYVEKITLGSLFIQLLYVVIAGPFAEELLFRGLVYGRLRRGMHWRMALLLASALFGLIHLVPIQMAYAFLAGIVFNLILVRYRSLWPCVAAHMAFNLTSIIISAIIGDDDNPAIVAGLFIAGFAITAGALLLAKKTAPVFASATAAEPEPAPAEIPGGGDD